VSVSNKRIYLVGLPGSGKSTFGRALAERLKWDFFDTDRLIEAQCGHTIAEIFSHEGEPYFRLKESEVLQECTRKAQAVIATGGGAVAHHGNMDVMLSTGLTVWLNPGLKEIARRLCADREVRPLFGQRDAKGIEARLLELLEKRAPYYRKSALMMNGEFSEDDLFLAVCQMIR
jgi:shikimate kinase